MAVFKLWKWHFWHVCEGWSSISPSLYMFKFACVNWACAVGYALCPIMKISLDRNPWLICVRCQWMRALLPSPLPYITTTVNIQSLFQCSFWTWPPLASKKERYMGPGRKKQVRQSQVVIASDVVINTCSERSTGIFTLTPPIGHSHKPSHSQLRIFSLIKKQQQSLQP